MSGELRTIDPTSGEVIEIYARMQDSEIEDAIERCHHAFLEWRLHSPETRAGTLHKIGDSLRQNKDRLSRLMSQEMGKLVEQSRQEVDLCAAICHWTAEQGPTELSPERRELGDGDFGLVTYAPIGVIYGIQPWNFPAYQVVRYSIANLMAGNGVLLKHAESVTGSGQLLEQIYRQAGLPEHLFSVLLIDHDQSDRVIEHELVRGVTLTGSAGAGRVVAEKAGRALKKSVLELGSNDAYLVREDTDIEQAVQTCVKGRVYNNGETCIAAKRFIVVDAVYDTFEQAFVKAMSEIRFGDPDDSEADIGPMAREDLRDILHNQVQDSVKDSGYGREHGGFGMKEFVNVKAVMVAA